MNDSYFPVRLTTIRPNEAITFDLFLNLDNRFIHYIRSHDELEGDRLKSLRSKGLRKVFIKKEDEQNYLLYLEDGLSTLMDKTQEISARGRLVHDTMITACENAEKTLETETGYNNQKKNFEKISEFLTSEKGSLKSVLAAAGISTDSNHHSATVSSLALSVAAKAGITNQNDIFELGIAALLHDIGKTRLKLDPFKRVSTMSAEELAIHKRHPQEGADLLAGKPYISPRILGLIVSHEEFGDGRGFPEKINLSSKPLPYQILNLVNKYDHFCTENQLLPSSAIDPFYEKHGQDFDEELISILATVLT